MIANLLDYVVGTIILAFLACVFLECVGEVVAAVYWVYSGIYKCFKKAT